MEREKELWSSDAGANPGAFQGLQLEKAGLGGLVHHVLTALLRST